MSDADELVKRLRCVADHVFSEGRRVKLLIDAADMIEEMAQRIEADNKAYRELERRHAD